MKIELIKIHWTVNGKTLAELTPAEYELLNQFFLEAKQELEKLKINL